MWRSLYLGHRPQTKEYLHMSKWVSDRVRESMMRTYLPRAKQTWWYASSSFTYSLIGLFVLLKAEDLALVCGEENYGVNVWRWEAFFLFLQGFISYASDVNCFGLTWYVARLDQVWASSLFCLQLAKSSRVSMDGVQVSIYATALASASLFFVAAQLCHRSMVATMEHNTRQSSAASTKNFEITDKKITDVDAQFLHQDLEEGREEGGEGRLLEKMASPPRHTACSPPRQEAMASTPLGGGSPSPVKRNAVVPRKSFAFDEDVISSNNYPTSCSVDSGGGENYDSNFVTGGVTCPTPALPASIPQGEPRRKADVPAAEIMGPLPGSSYFALQCLLPFSERCIGPPGEMDEGAVEKLPSSSTSEACTFDAAAEAGANASRRTESRYFRSFLFYHTLWHYAIPGGAFLWVQYTTSVLLALRSASPSRGLGLLELEVA